MTSRAFSLCSTACIATCRTRWHKKSHVAQQLLAQLTVDAGSCCLQGLKSASCSFRQCAFCQNRPSRTCVLDFASLVRDFFGLSCGGAFRRMRFSDSAGINLSRYQVSANSAEANRGASVFAEGSRYLSHLLHANCMARSVSACLSWRDATFFGQHRTSALQLKSSHHKIFESHATGCAGDTGTCTWVAIVGPTSPWVFEPSTTGHWSWPRLNPECGCGWAAAAPDPVKVSPLQEFYEIIPVVIFQCMGSFVFCPNKPKTRASACENCKAKRSKSADLCTAMHAPVIHVRRSVTCQCICKWTVVRVENQAACAVEPDLFPWWRWQICLQTARLWTPVTSSFLDGSS